MDKFRTLIELLRLRADSNERKVKFTDEEIEQENSKKRRDFYAIIPLNSGKKNAKMKKFHPYNVGRRVTISFIITKPNLNKNIIQESISKKPKFKRTFFRTRREKPRHSVEPSKCEIPRIINLSAPEIQILSKGLKFTPTPQTSNYNEVKDDISNFCRKLRLTEELFDKENPDESIVRNKSTYKSSKGKNKALDTFCDHITHFPLTKYKVRNADQIQVVRNGKQYTN
ncbi:unnamed protein product [Mytilus edulis]|uniref:Uncharacterized protein n=1 Tax=Mytilus edulis TaxID=6550 RepID=A0A8S3UI02_MYTED|nr:unnamed protein product [Mytilus edulis]